MEEATCPSCAHNNRVGSKFCHKCGKALWLQDRYLLGTILERASGQAVYVAFDKRRCGSSGCGAWVEDMASAVCSACNASPYPFLLRELYQRSGPPLPHQADLAGMSYWFYEEIHDTWFGLTKPKWNIDWFPNGQWIEMAGATDKGQTYKHNEDAILMQTATCYFNSLPYSGAVLAVADGMGGHENGEIASKVCVTGLLVASFRLLTMGFDLTDNALDETQLQEMFRQVILQANQAVFAQHQTTHSNLGAVVTAAWVLKGLAIIANVGDSRSYLYRAGRLQQITNDHSLVYRMMLNREITRDEIYGHPQRNVIYRSLGDKEEVDVETFVIKLEPDDILVLCCDGLWEMIRDEGIEQILATDTELQVACNCLVQQANDAGGEDNISVVLARIRAP